MPAIRSKSKSKPKSAKQRGGTATTSEFDAAGVYGSLTVPTVDLQKMPSAKGSSVPSGYEHDISAAPVLNLKGGTGLGSSKSVLSMLNVDPIPTPALSKGMKGGTAATPVPAAVDASSSWLESIKQGIEDIREATMNGGKAKKARAKKSATKPKPKPKSNSKSKRSQRGGEADELYTTTGAFEKDTYKTEKCSDVATPMFVDMKGGFGFKDMKDSTAGVLGKLNKAIKGKLGQKGGMDIDLVNQASDMMQKYDPIEKALSGSSPDIAMMRSYKSPNAAAIRPSVQDVQIPAMLPNQAGGAKTKPKKVTKAKAKPSVNKSKK